MPTSPPKKIPAASRRPAPPRLAALPDPILASNPEPEAPPAILSIEPEPIEVRVCYLGDGQGGWVTSIYRGWSPGDEGRCRRCDRCNAYDGGCLIQVRQLVPREAAASFDVRGREFRRPPDREPAVRLH